MLDYGFYNADCMEGMRDFQDKYFDLAIVDPPYGDGMSDDYGSGGWYKNYRESDDSKREYWNRFGQRFDRYKQGQISWDVAPGKEYFDELFRVSKNQVIWGGNYFALPPTRCFLIWRKTNVPENFSMAMAEYAWTSFNKNAKIFEFSAVGQPGRFHPTQKPVQLYKWILSNFANPGDIILDTHVGSGSSLIACEDTGHKYIGFEINEDYYEKAKERIQNETAQQSIFSLGWCPYEE